MKNLMIISAIASIWFTTPKLFANPNWDASNAFEKQDHQLKHGRHGKDGQNGQNGEDGEDGKNGGNGGNGGHGSSGWWRGGNGGNGGNAVDLSTNSSSEQETREIDPLEYSLLKQKCREIIFTTVSKFCDPFDNLCSSVCKQNISLYLLQIGTESAKKIWDEYENVRWSYPEIAYV